MRCIKILFVFLILCLPIFGFQQNSPSPLSEKWDAFAKQFVESYLSFHPNFAVYLGRHDFDGMLPDWTPAGLKKQVAWLHKEHDFILTFNKKALDTLRQLDYENVLTTINSDLFWLESVESPYHNPAYYSLNPSVYVTRPFAPLNIRLIAYIRYAKAIPAAVAQIKNNLRPPLHRPYIDIGKILFGGLASYFEKDIPGVFDQVKDKKLQEEFHTANLGAINALKELSAWLEQQKPTANDSFALGSKLFSEMLRVTECVDVPLAELEKLGKKDLERNLASLQEVCALFSPGKTVRECITMVQSHKPIGGPLEEARKQLKELKEFISANNIVTIPGNEDVVVKESPPYARWNPASMYPPGPFEKNVPCIYYISLPDSSWSEKARNDYLPDKATLLFVSLHEVWPGHFLQYLHSYHHPSDIGKIFLSYAYEEGWAHYTEEMMWEAGFHNGNPETHIGQLTEALMRNVRYLSAIGLHTGGMTLQQSETMFREQAFLDSVSAKQQAVRGTFDPEYIKYTLGKLMIKKLRDDWTASRDGRKAWREFHDIFLSYGGIPIPVIREIMLGPNNGSLFDSDTH
jgi:uncharacterized protein (DUF885 family)